MPDYSRIQHYYIACGYTDMRKQIDGLSAIIQMQFGKEMNEESIFLFCGHKVDRIKALYWDGTGYVLLYKRITESHIRWPRNEKDLKQLSRQEFQNLLDGLSTKQQKTVIKRKPGANF